MKKLLLYPLIPLIPLFISIRCYSQTNIVLNTTVAPGNYSASSSVEEQPGAHDSVSGNDSIHLFINTSTQLSVAASNRVICAGMSDTLVASGASSYRWSNGITASTLVVTPSQTTIYTITATYDWSPVGAEDTIKITVNLPPAAPVITALDADSDSYAVTADSAVNFAWTASDVYGNFAGTGDTAYLIYWPQNCHLTFTATSIANGCSSSSYRYIGHSILSSYNPPYNLPYPQYSKRGMYLEHCGNILDTLQSVKEQIKNYCLQNKITYVLMDGLNTDGSTNGVFYTNKSKIDTTEATKLQNFIALLKDSGGVEEVGTVCYGNYDYMAFNAGNYDIGNMLSSFIYYNKDTLPDHKIDVLSLDEETFWENTSSYPIVNLQNSIRDFNTVHMPMLRAMYNAAHDCPSDNIRVEDYIGGLNPDTTRFRNKTAVTMADSIGKYADRVLNSSYTEYPSDLLGRYSFHLLYLQFAHSRTYKDPIEIWPVLAAPDNLTYYCDSTDYLGDSMSVHHEKPDYMEGRYFDSLRLWENLHRFDSTKFSTDTNFKVCGSMWWHYHCLSNYTFDTSTATGAIKYYVSVGPSIQWHEHLPVWRPQPPITVTAKVFGGKAPYTYVWYDDTSHTILQSGSSNTYIAHWPYSPRISVLVVDANNSPATDYLYIYQECHQAPLHNSNKRDNSMDNSQASTFNSSLRIYPNPANTQLFVENDLAVNPDNSVQKSFVLYDVLGKKVLSVPLMPGQKLNIYDISTLSQGLYIYNITTDANVEQRGKIIIMH